MRTKLVYVLTCSVENHYIEQALLAIFSARHWNPDAHIVLMVDNLTDQLLFGNRSKILKYISEKVVIPFEDDSLSMTYRSRFIKTSVRELVEGDFLFVDCDTITGKNLNEVDSFECLIGAVPDSHLAIHDFGNALMEASKTKVGPIGIDLEKEEYYFSSGVLYVKDAPETHSLYKAWHSIWLQGTQKGTNIDQPSLAKANIEAGHLIRRIDDKYNCVIYTQPDFAKDAYILHFTAYRNPSWLFSLRVLEIIRQEGIREWIVPFILNPVSSYIPFRYTISRMSFKELIKCIINLASSAKVYSNHVDASFTDMDIPSRWHKKAKVYFKKRKFTLGSVFCIFPSWLSLKLKRGETPTPNICAR